MEAYPFHLTRPIHAAKTFIPLSIANIIRDPGAGLSGMFSFGIYGTPYDVREEQAGERAAAKRKEYEQDPTKFKRAPPTEDQARERSRKRAEREQKQKFKPDAASP